VESGEGSFDGMQGPASFLAEDLVT